MDTRYLYLNSRDEFYRIDISAIAYFEAEGNYTNIVLANSQKGVMCMNLAQMQNVLNESLRERVAQFARVGKRYIINLDYVYRIETLKQRLVLSDGRTFAFALPISKEALKKLKDLYITSITGAPKAQ